MTDFSSDVAIIGGGPAGLAVAACLARENIKYTLLERGPAILAALRRIDPEMMLLSPAGFSRLPGMNLEFPRSSYISFQTFVEALDKYSQEQRIAVVTRAEVKQVSRTQNRFEVRWQNADGAVRELYAHYVVNATGIITTPCLPTTFDPSTCSVPWKYSIDTRGSDLASVGHLLVVGGGASAAEVLDRWLEVRKEDSHAWLSLRSRLLAFTNPILGFDIHYWIWLPEQLPSRLLGWRAARIPEGMNGTQVLPAIKKGLISSVSEIAKYSDDSVVTTDGQRLQPDLVVFATGFRYAAEHLADLLNYDPDGRPRVCCCESTQTPGLFLLGYKFGRTFASPYIRGIARDAKYVAGRVAQKLKQRV